MTATPAGQQQNTPMLPACSTAAVLASCHTILLLLLLEEQQQQQLVNRMMRLQLSFTQTTSPTLRR